MGIWQGIAILSITDFFIHPWEKIIKLFLYFVSIVSEQLS